jgi:small-conductance mechanosensitive channel
VASNYVSGFIILLERSVRIGDRVTIDNRTGYITQITARYTVLKGMDGTEMLVPNEALIANTVVNQSYSDPSLWFALPVQVAYGTDLDHALAVLVEAAKSVPRVMTDPEPSAFVVAFADSGINLEVGIWCADPDKGLLGLKSDVNLAIWRRFNQAGIHIPFPQREVRVQPPVAAAAVAPAVAGAANP